MRARERIALHQEEPQCAQCHRRIDPIGFGLENFDASGKWRIHDDSKDVPPDRRLIDPSGKIHKGPAFKDYFELRDIIAKDYPEAFATGFAEHLAEYALGRPIGFTDANLISSITEYAKAKDFAISEFIYALVLSDSFGEKR